MSTTTTKSRPILRLPGTPPPRAAAPPPAPKPGKPAAPTLEEQRERTARLAARTEADALAHKLAAARKYASNKAIAERLRTAYPALFGPGINQPLPLACGIHTEISRALDIKRHHLGAVLKRHVERKAYLVAIAAGGPRYHLDGTEADPITEAQQANARARLADGQE